MEMISGRFFSKNVGYLEVVGRVGGIERDELRSKLG